MTPSSCSYNPLFDLPSFPKSSGATLHPLLMPNGSLLHFVQTIINVTPQQQRPSTNLQIIPPNLPLLSLFALALTPTAIQSLPPQLLVPTYLPPQPQRSPQIPINLAPTSINTTANPRTQKIKTAGNVAKKVTSQGTVPTTRPTLKYGASSNNVKN